MSEHQIQKALWELLDKYSFGLNMRYKNFIYDSKRGWLLEHKNGYTVKINGGFTWVDFLIEKNVDNITNKILGNQ